MNQFRHSVISNLILSAILLAVSSACSGDRVSVATASTLSDSTSCQSVVTDTITLALVGDIMMGTTFPDSVGESHLPAADGARLFDACGDILRRADLACGNLEGTLLDGPGERRRMGDPKFYYVFRTPTHYVKNLADAGFDFLGIANNHINDFGLSGRRSTIAALRDAGIQFAGLKGRCETAFVNRKGLRIGLTQFGHGGGNLDVTDLDELRRVVAALRDSADVVVVAFHGGAEGKDRTHVPFATERFAGENRGDVARFAHAAIDAGADVVYGHGPHVPRGIEIYRDRIILYSLGNFCTPYRVSISGISGYAPLAEIRITADGRFISGRIHSFIQRYGHGPAADSTHRAATLIRSLSLDDFPASHPSISSTGIIRPARH